MDAGKKQIHTKNITKNMSVAGSHILPQIIRAAEPVAKWMRQEFLHFDRQHIEEKASHDLVSYVDRESEQKLIDTLLPLMPGSAVLAEESGKSGSAEWMWVIDPLDGTTNFTHGIPCFCISIALLQNGEPMGGVIIEAYSGDVFSAWKGKGAYRNGQSIQVNPVREMHKALFATGFPVNNYEHLEVITASVGRFMQNTRGLRRFGTAAMDLAWTAMGRFAGFYEFGLSPWDVAAGALIVTEAGGKISDLHGSTQPEDWMFGKNICASNGHLHEEMLQLIQMP